MLTLNKITKKFPGREKPVLDQIDLSILPREFCVVIGSNGSGKSTLLKTISGEHDLDAGEIILDKNQLIASVTQDVNKGCIAEMSLLENMVLSCLHGKQAKYCFYNNSKERVISIISSLNLGLEEYIDKPIGQLSGGQRQIIATLMAINSAPDILLLDEHTSALDPKTGKFLMEYTANKILENNLVSLMVTHKLDDALKFGNRLIMLHQGKIVFDVRDKDKASLTINQLLDLFHQYESLTLMD